MPTQQGSNAPVRQPEEAAHSARIKVVGVGGGGSNAIDRMIDFGVEGVEFIALNTDIQALKVSKAPVRGQIGSRLTHGLSAGSDPDIGRRAAIEDAGQIAEALEGADMVFITAGLGGGTGTGAAPVIAAIASEMGALTVALVTRPFGFEGKRRMAVADWGIHHLLNYVDTLIVIPNEKLLAFANDAPFFESFRIADDFLRQAVQGISDIITTAGVINRDFADVKTTMTGMGYAVMGTASRSGPTRAVDAVMAAMESPLLEAGAIDGARGILINITGSSTLRLSEVNDASTAIQSVAHEDANIIFGAVLDERLGDEVKVTVIATGFRSGVRDHSGRRATMLRGTEPERAMEASLVAAPVDAVQRLEPPEPDQHLQTVGPAEDVALIETAHTEAEEIRTEQHEAGSLESDGGSEAIFELQATSTVEESQNLALDVDEEPIEQPPAEFHEEQDWRDAIREIARLAEPDFEPQRLAVEEADPHDGIDQTHHTADLAESSYRFGSDGDDRWTVASERADEAVDEARTLQQDRTPSLQAEAETAAPVSTSRQAAMAAYGGAFTSETEPEPQPTMATNAFARILEARRRVADSLREDTFTVERVSEPKPLHTDAGSSPTPNDVPVVEVVHEALVLSLSEAATPHQAAHPEYHRAEVPARPLPDFNRRLRHDDEAQTRWDFTESHQSAARVPSFATIPDDDSFTDEFDELDIPAFLRRGP